jgi:hypothetical protein
MPFKPGVSGNPAGSTKNRRFFDALDRAIAQDDSKRLRAAADKLLDLAAEGEPWAVQMLADRLDGRALQSIDATVTNNSAPPAEGESETDGFLRSLVKPAPEAGESVH